MKLQGKVAVITGGARGNGLATAKLMAEEGVDIVIADICQNMNTIPYDMSTEDTMAGAVESIKSMGRKALGIKCDVRKSAEVEAMVDQVMETFGKSISWSTTPEIPPWWPLPKWTRRPGMRCWTPTSRAPICAATSCCPT